MTRSLPNRSLPNLWTQKNRRLQRKKPGKAGAYDSAWWTELLLDFLGPLLVLAALLYAAGVYG